MTLTMERPVLIPFRWLDHHLDIRACVVDECPLFAADDICRALDAFVDVDHDEFMNVDHKTYPAPTELVPGVEDAVGQPVAFFTVDIVRALANERPMYIAEDHGEFADWFEDLLEQQMSGAHLEELVDGAQPDEPGLKAGESYSVSTAARLLSRDPALRYGQQSLFATMNEALGWISRDAGVWVPADGALRNGFLVRLTRRIAGTKVPYTQVRITPAGLQQLHTRLGGVATLALETPAQPALVEI